jgi:hypothetical protein
MNDVLFRYYRQSLSRVIPVIALAVGALIAFGWSPKTNQLFDKVIAIITSTAAIGGLFLMFEKLVRVRLWRIAYPEFDFEGRWSGHTNYLSVYGGSTMTNQGFCAFSTVHDIQFEQDCLSIRVVYDESEAFLGWNSTLATIFNEGGRTGLRYAYEVTYRKGKNTDYRLPDKSSGLEELFVVGPKVGRKPSRVTGTFSHALSGSTPMYSGTVEFTRATTNRYNNMNWITRVMYFLERSLVTLWLGPVL